MSQKKIIKAIFDNINTLTAQDIEKSAAFKKLLKDKIPECIEEAFKNNKIVATIFEINYTNVYIDLPKRSWIPALEKCLMWYVEEEDYTACTNIKKLINSLKEKSSPKTKVDVTRA
jgi:hypothetical protein